MFGDGPLGREICGEEAGIRALPDATIREFWRTTYRPANTVVAVAGDLDHGAAVELAATAFGTGNGVVPGFAPAPALPAGRARPGRQASHGAGPARRRCPGAASRPSRRVDAGLLNAVLGDGMSSRLFLSVREERGLAYDISSGLVDYADAGALEISAGVDPDALDDALAAILVELARLRDEPVPAEELDKAKRYLSGGLELRMDETRHVASWIGGQEALHDRVLTVDEALAEVDGRHRRRHPAASRRRWSSTRGCGWQRSRQARRAARPRPPPSPARHERPVRAGGRERSPDLVLARLHLRLGSLSLARAELETLAGKDMLDAEGVIDLAEARWRTGDITGAGEAAALVIDDDEGPVLALIVAAEAAAARGRPSEARRLAAKALRCGGRFDRHDLRRDAAEPGLAAGPGSATAVADDDVRRAHILGAAAADDRRRSSGEPAGGAGAVARPGIAGPAGEMATTSGAGLWDDDLAAAAEAEAESAAAVDASLPTGDEALETGRAAPRVRRRRRCGAPARARAADRPGARAGRDRCRR